MRKRPILCLNAGYIPLGTGTWQNILVKIFSGAAHPVDITYAQRSDGSLDPAVVEYFDVVRNWKDWIDLDIREEVDDFVHTTSGPVRLPSVVVCSRFNRVHYKRVSFPTKHNIFKRDKYTCGYTGKMLQKDELSVDHILPVSRGGLNTWENMVTCDKKINNFKDNRLPNECGLKLQIKPTRPVNGMDQLVLDTMREDWGAFLMKN